MTASGSLPDTPAVTSPAARDRGPLTALRHAFAPMLEARGLARWMVWTGIGLVALFVVLAIFAPQIAPYDWNQYCASLAHGTCTGPFPKQAAPSHLHWFGTTVQSTDVFSRVIYGARTALQVVLLAVVFSVCVGVPLGLVSGYFGGWLDRALVLVMDALFAFPYLLLAIVIAFLLENRIGGGVMTSAVAITVVYVPQYFRVIRNSVITVREELYVEAARALGARPFTVIFRYVFFNVIQTVPVVASLNAADAIITLAGLSFLGVGLNPNAAAQWGYDISRAISDAQAGYWWTGMFPGLALILLVTGLTMAGEGMNDTLNPVLRGRGLRRVVLPARSRAGGEERTK
jgi:peptide/nickel transport system permease protein